MKTNANLDQKHGTRMPKKTLFVNLDGLKRQLSRFFFCVQLRKQKVFITGIFFFLLVIFLLDAWLGRYIHN